VDAGEDLTKIVAAAGFGEDGVYAAAHEGGVVYFGGIASYENHVWGRTSVRQALG
jgi:hypothetical protein